LIGERLIFNEIFVCRFIYFSSFDAPVFHGERQSDGYFFHDDEVKVGAFVSDVVDSMNTLLHEIATKHMSNANGNESYHVYFFI
jgi:hypothetical protein